MTLTEQWKRDELPVGFYYLKIDDGENCFYDVEEFNGDYFGFYAAADIKEVLAPVPSYEEWKSMGKFSMEAMKVAEENQQLKGYNEYLRNIIKECEPHIENVCIALDMEKFANGGFLHKSNELLSKIRNAIGEK